MSLIEQALKRAQVERANPNSATRPGEPTQKSKLAPPLATSYESPAPVVRPTRIVNFDRAQLRAAGLLAPTDQERTVAHQIRAIKRALMKDALDVDSENTSMLSPRLIAVASALPGDGKTFTTLNLALSMALERDCQTLLVDADVAKPQLTSMLGLDKEDGLLDLLREPGRSVESVIFSTTIPGLSVMPAGRWSETASELLASDRMREVTAALSTRQHRGLVLFDSPPALVTSEARVLASLAGQVLIVVNAGVTPQQAVRDTVELFSNSNHRLSVMLNRVNESGPMSYVYGYGYGHDKEYPRPDGTEPAATSQGEDR